MGLRHISEKRTHNQDGKEAIITKRCIVFKEKYKQRCTCTYRNRQETEMGGFCRKGSKCAREIEKAPLIELSFTFLVRERVSDRYHNLNCVSFLPLLGSGGEEEKM